MIVREKEEEIKRETKRVREGGRETEKVRERMRKRERGLTCSEFCRTGLKPNAGGVAE